MRCKHKLTHCRTFQTAVCLHKSRALLLYQRRGRAAIPVRRYFWVEELFTTTTMTTTKTGLLCFTAGPKIANISERTTKVICSFHGLPYPRSTVLFWGAAFPCWDTEYLLEYSLILHCLPTEPPMYFVKHIHATQTGGNVELTMSLHRLTGTCTNLALSWRWPRRTG